MLTDKEIIANIRRAVDRAIHNIAVYGISVMGVGGDDDVVPFSYSVGFFVAEEPLPEIVIFGLPSAAALQILNGCYDRTQAAEEKIVAGERTEKIIADGFDVIFVESTAAELKELGYPLSMSDATKKVLGHEGPDDVLVMYWPDGNNVFPWEEGFDTKLTGFQPFVKNVELISSSRPVDSRH